MKTLLITLLLSTQLIVAGCSTTGKIGKVEKSPRAEKIEKSENTERSKTSSAPVNGAPTEVAIEKKIYALQHKIIPKWVFESNGMFFSDMRSGNISPLILTATNIVSAEFAKGIAVRPILDRQAVLITFPEPEHFVLCYFVIVEKIGSDYRYITYEKTFPFGDEKGGGVVGGWNKKGDHENYGPRLYKTADEFVKDALGL